MVKFAPKKNEKDIISLRIPANLLEIVDTKATVYGISRNAFINQCILFALENMEDTHDIQKREATL